MPQHSIFIIKAPILNPYSTPSSIALLEGALKRSPILAIDDLNPQPVEAKLFASGFSGSCFELLVASWLGSRGLGFRVVRGMFRNDWHASNVIKIRKEHAKNTRGNTRGNTRSNPAAGDNTRKIPENHKKNTRKIQDGRLALPSSRIYLVFFPYFFSYFSRTLF